MRRGLQHQAATESAVPAHTVDIEHVRLGRVDGHVEGERGALVDAARRRVALDLVVDVVSDGEASIRDLPESRAGLQVFDDDRIGSLRQRRYRAERHRSGDEQGNTQFGAHELPPRSSTSPGKCKVIRLAGGARQQVQYGLPRARPTSAGRPTMLSVTWPM